MLRAVSPQAPYDLLATVRLLQRRPTSLTDRWLPDGYLRLVRTSAGLVVASARQRGDIWRPHIELRLAPDATPPTLRHRAATEAADVLRDTLGLDLPPPDLRPVVRIAPALGVVATRLAGMRAPRFADFFEAVLNVVPFQQVSLEAGIAVLSRVVLLLGEHREVDGAAVWAAPTAEAVADTKVARLRETGLSWAKAEALQGIAQQLLDGRFDPEMLRPLTSDQAVERLCAFPRIGPWSAGLLLLRGMRRLDVFPSGDAGAARTLAAFIPQDGNEARLEALAARLADKRGYLYFLALGSQLVARDLLPPLDRESAGAPLNERA